MTISKAKKVEILATLETLLKDAKSVAFTTNNKLTMPDVDAIRKELRTVDATFILSKKTLIKIAFKNVYNVEIDDALLPNQIALTIARADAVAGAGIVNKFAKDKEFAKDEKIKFTGGFFDGRVIDGTEMSKLAGLPSREVLLAKLLGSMMAPLSSLARFLDAAKKDVEAKNLKTVADLVSFVAKKEEAPKVEEKKEEVAAPVVEAPEAPVAEEVKAEETPVVEVAPEAPAAEEVAPEAPAAEETPAE